MGMEQLKALLHIDEVNKWTLTLNNVFNLLADKGETGVIVEVLVNGPAVSVFNGTTTVDGMSGEALIAQMRSLAERNVTFAVCHNALRSQAIDEQQLPAFITVVPAGITELLIQQVNGYFYVKP